MTRRRTSPMIIYPFVRRKGSRMKLIVALTILLGLQESRGEYMMGGHLDNKGKQELPVMEGRMDDETSRSSVVFSRKSSVDDQESDYDLELDLIGEKSDAVSTRTSVISDGSPTIDETSMNDEDDIAPRYRVHPYAFNGGEPFSLEKDPITGQIDFEKAPPLKALEYSVKKTSDNADEPGATMTNENFSPDLKDLREDTSLGPNEINPYSPSFHDFLNLPIRYTYERYENAEKYPLISNSYANTKVQSGTNSYNTYNHKKYHEAVKPGVDIQTLYVQPSRKTYIQSVTRTSTRPSIATSKFETTTRLPMTTSKKSSTTPTTKTTTTTTTPVSTASTTVKPYTRYHAVTTWKPQQIPSVTNIYGIYTDYEGTLPIERLQQGISTSEKQSSTEKSSIKPDTSNTEEATRNEEYEETYDDDYDRVLQIANESPSPENQSNEFGADYAYSGMDNVRDTRPVVKTETSAATTSAESSTTSRNFVFVSDATTSTTRPTTITSTSNNPRPVNTNNKDIRVDRATSPRPVVNEEKPVTSMPIDTIGNSDNYRVTSTNYGSNGLNVGTIDNSIPSVTSNNVLYQHNRPSINDNYDNYARPPIGIETGDGIVVKSTSNVVVPPGQDTVSFVLGNRQSVGSVTDAGSEYYGIHGPATINDRPTISFGKIGNSRPTGPIDHFSGQMIVSAGIGVGSNPIGTYHQRPPTNGNNYDHAVVTVGMPTVDIVNPSDTGIIASVNNNNNNNNVDSSTNSLDSLAQKWWASTSSSANTQQAIPHVTQESSNQQFGYRVVFPGDKGQISGSNRVVTNDNPSGIQWPLEEHLIVANESVIGNSNAQHIDPSSQSTTSPTTGYHQDTTTKRLSLKNGNDEQLPVLSESLTPPAEIPNIPQTVLHNAQRPSSSSYNYYHHQSHSAGTSRPTDYQRLPQRLPLPSSAASSSNSFKRRPPSSSIDTNLPNILPQFRPNAKTSHGHNRGETIGTIPAGPVPPYTRLRRPSTNIHHSHNQQQQHHHHHHHHHHRPPTSRRPDGPSHLQRLNPPPLPPPITSLRLPTPVSLVALPNLGITNQHESASQNSENVNRLGGQNRLHKVSVGDPPSLAIDERHNSGFTVSQQIKSRLEDETLERFSAEPPSRPPYFTKRTTNGEQLPDGMPRIATLQMIQQHGGSRDDEAINLPPPYRFNNEKSSSNRQDSRENEQSRVTEENSSTPSVNRRGDENEDNSEDFQRGNESTRADYVDTVDSPIYVVYPVKGALDIRPTSNENDDETDHNDASVVLGTYGSQRPLPPDTLLQGSDDNESVNVADNSETIYRPSTIVGVSPTFADSSAPQLASDFPYPLERPDPSIFTSQLREKPLLVPSEQRKDVDRPEIEANEEKNNDKRTNNSEDGVIRDIERHASVNVIPYLQDHVPFVLKENAGVISATLHRLGQSSSNIAASSTPIAYVYTPTTRTPVRHEDAYPSYGRGTVLLPSQQPSSSSSSAPSPQSFMAPFVASASAEAPTKNGWSVVMMKQSSSDDSINNDRRRHDAMVRENEATQTTKVDNDGTNEKTDLSDDRVNNEKEMSVMRTKDEETIAETEKSEFDVENFTPQLFGGFQPIFEFPSDTETDPTMGDKVSGDTIVQRPRSETV